MSKIYFIAEIGVNHEASLKKAYDHIIAAKNGGAQAIKLQSYKAEKIVSKYARAYWDKKVEKEANQLKLYRKFDGFNFCRITNPQQPQLKNIIQFIFCCVDRLCSIYKRYGYFAKFAQCYTTSDQVI